MCFAALGCLSRFGFSGEFHDCTELLGSLELAFMEIKWKITCWKISSWSHTAFRLIDFDCNKTSSRGL
jgi:hypothetical protein